MGQRLEYTLTPTELIIRAAGKERRVLLEAVIAATYLQPIDRAPAGNPRRASSLKQAVAKKMLDTVASQAASQGTLFLRMADPSFRMQTVVLDASREEGKVFLRLLKERVSSRLTTDAISLDEVYRFLGAPFRLHLLLWLPKLMFIGVLVLAIAFILSTLIQ